MTKDKLFLLKPDFRNGDQGPFYCPDCARIEGLLSYYPKLRHKLDVHYVDFPRPRAALVAELGEAHQGCPMLVLAEGRRVLDPGLDVQEANGRRFIADEGHIRRYLSATFGIGTAA